jgi:hypothetical protein
LSPGLDYNLWFLRYIAFTDKLKTCCLLEIHWIRGTKIYSSEHHVAVERNSIYKTKLSVFINVKIQKEKIIINVDGGYFVATRLSDPTATWTANKIGTPVRVCSGGGCQIFYVNKVF